MTRAELEDLLERPESDTLDWKADFPRGLAEGRSDPAWETAKATVLKDVVAVANAVEEQRGYVVYGVLDQGTSREVRGKTGSWDDATFQTWAANAFDPPPDFSYSEVAWDDFRSVGVFVIRPHPDYPHVAKQSIGGVLHEGQVWIRRGSMNSVALNQDLRCMFRGTDPIIDSRSNGPIVTAAANHYRELGYEPVLPRWVDRDVKEAEGYRIAFYPGTRRHVVVVDPRGDPDLVLMLKPRSA